MNTNFCYGCGEENRVDVGSFDTPDILECLYCGFITKAFYWRTLPPGCLLILKDWEIK